MKAQQALQQAYFDLGLCTVQATIAKSAVDAAIIALRLTQAVESLSLG